MAKQTEVIESAKTQDNFPNAMGIKFNMDFNKEDLISLVITPLEESLRENREELSKQLGDVNKEHQKVRQALQDEADQLVKSHSQDQEAVRLASQMQAWVGEKGITFSVSSVLDEVNVEELVVRAVTQIDRVTDNGRTSSVLETTKSLNFTKSMRDKVNELEELSKQSRELNSRCDEIRQVLANLPTTAKNMSNAMFSTYLSSNGQVSPVDLHAVMRDGLENMLDNYVSRNLLPEHAKDSAMKALPANLENNG